MMTGRIVEIIQVGILIIGIMNVVIVQGAVAAGLNQQRIRMSGTVYMRNLIVVDAAICRAPQAVVVHLIASVIVLEIVIEISCARSGPHGDARSSPLAVAKCREHWAVNVVVADLPILATV